MANDFYDAVVSNTTVTDSNGEMPTLEGFDLAADPEEEDGLVDNTEICKPPKNPVVRDAMNQAVERNKAK